ncbi:MAG TPA: cyclase family protein [Actinomycetota bacterium]|jgi:kynurenine formamidase
MRYVELSHPLQDGMEAYPGMGSVHVGPILDHEGSRDRYKGKAEFYLGRVEMPVNTGTYLDAPFHRLREGEDLADLPLSRLAGLPGVVARARGAIDAVDIGLEPADVRGKAVVVDTGWSERWGTPSYWEEMPYLSTASLDLLIEGKAAMVAVDFGNVDDTNDPVRPAHTRLLEAGILIVESLADPGALPDDGFRFFATPPRIVRGASFPVRAFAQIDVGR